MRLCVSYPENLYTNSNTIMYLHLLLGGGYCGQRPP